MIKTDKENFISYLATYRKEKNIRLFFDIETLKYNSAMVVEHNHPTDYRNVTYSVAISWLENDSNEVHTVVFPNYKFFFDTVMQGFKNSKGEVYKKTPKIELIAHNNNKYDNHFKVVDLLYYYPFMKVENIHLKMATDKGNLLAKKIGDLKVADKQGLILEKRIKSSNNLELVFFLKGIQFNTTDNYMKTNLPLKTLGEKLFKRGLIKEEELKTEFDYKIFDREYNMTDDEAHEYALMCHGKLTPFQLTYIRNDVIILAKSVLYYSVLFNGFDYNKITFTSNILAYYNDNDLTSFQLLNKIGEGNQKMAVNYTDYKFAGENFYDYLKPFYKGGLNFYNQYLVATIVKGKSFSIDINSSYPFAMHNFKIPTFMKSFNEFEKETEVKIEFSDDEYTLYRMEKYTFDRSILDKIESKIIKQMLVKYYGSHEFININSYTLRMIENITTIKFTTLKVLSTIVYETEYFGSREKIEESYFVKTQGKEKNKILMPTPYNITVTDEPNLDGMLSDEEIDNAKVILNGLYGIPALRPYFNLFRKVGENIINIPNGYENNQRNIVFSIFVTSVALYNLLSPFKFLTPQQIDENFIYSDTDSLYLKQEVRHLIPDSFFHDMNLGRWSLDYEEITNMYVLNHKKYAFEYFDEKTQKLKIKVKSGGIPTNSFNTDMSFEKFIETEFSEGIEVKNLKSIYNSGGTITLYDSITKLDKGGNYRNRTFNPRFDEMKKQLFDEIRNDTIYDEDDVMYIESNLGTFSMAELHEKKHKLDNKRPLDYLLWLHEDIKDTLILN